ncbi:MAG: dihydropyrimidinase [Peptococcaceae bacterium]|nr:dihydropyrimidinase [Peptococcaceae bacterium]
MDKLIKGGTLVTPRGMVKGSLLIQGEKIAALGEAADRLAGLPAAGAAIAGGAGFAGGTAKTDGTATAGGSGLARGTAAAGGADTAAGLEIVDAEGCLVFPGFIDTHTHFQLNNGYVISPDDFDTGTKAALLGGTTTILDFATQNRGETLGQGLANWHAMAGGRANCDYGFHMAISRWDRAAEAAVQEMADAGVTSFKVYMAYDNLRVSDAEIFEILQKIAQVGGILGCHCENGDLVNVLVRQTLAAGITGPEGHPLSRPPEVEAEAVYRYLTIAKMAGCPVNIVHTSTRRALETVAAARAEGQEVYVETCPQYLLFTDERYSLPDFAGAKYVMSPPLRKEEDRQALWQALAEGEVDTVGTDHCSFSLNQKALGREDFSRIPNGIPGVEHRPELIYTYGVMQGRISALQMAKLLAENPAKLFGLYPRKGVLAPGSDADLVIWNTRIRKVITAENQNHNVDNTPYEGLAVIGGPRQVYLRGRLAAAEGRLVIAHGGQYLFRGPGLRFRQ